MSKEELTQITDLVTDNTLFCTKEVLTSDEAARYMGISKSYLYIVLPVFRQGVKLQ